MARASLGEQELDVLRYVTEHGAVTVREVALSFGEPRGLARTTVLTVMENLRTKGYLTRKKGFHAWEYTAVVPKAELLRRLMSDFVEHTLKGSVSPVAAYLAGARDVSEEELEELERVVRQLRSQRGKEGDA